MKVDLLDILPSVEVVKIDNEREIELRGVSVPVMASIIGRFPALESILREGFGDDLIPRLIIGCAASIGPIIAAATGHLADETYERAATDLVAHQQVKFLKAIFKISFPNGLGSFVDQLTELMGGSVEGAVTTEIKMRSRKLPSISPPLSDEAFPPTLQ
jgi:hypothetical protein